MEIGLREWLIIGGAALVLLIVVDGLRRMRGPRSRLRMDIENPPSDLPAEEDNVSFNPELPNGGARRVAEGEEKVSDTPLTGSPAPDLDTPDAVTDSTPLSAELPSVSLEGERKEPTFTLSPDPTEPVEPASPQSELSSESATETVEPAQPEKAARPVDNVVVEEDIMSSAALFEAIDFSRKQRVSDLELELDQSPQSSAQARQQGDDQAMPAMADEVNTQPVPVESQPERQDSDADAEASTPVVAAQTEPHPDQPETSAPVETPEITEPEAVPVRKADPLLRPLDGADETDLSIAPEDPAAAQQPPITLDTPVSDDPLMAGVDEALLEDDAGQPRSAEIADTPEQGSEHTDLLEGLSARDESVQVGKEKQSSLPAETTRRVEPSIEPVDLGDDLELELPGEFAPAPKPVPSVVALKQESTRTPVEPIEQPAPMVEPSRDDPAPTTPVQSEPAMPPEEQPPVEAASIDPVDTSVTPAEVVDESAADNDMTVKGGSLRQQPDPANVLVMTVISQDPHGFSGSALLQLVMACGMRFGEMDIFHRFEDGIDSGAVQFSMANATGNGVFDIHDMAAVHTRAVSFFMSMEEPREVMNAFECMLATAETLARHLNGELVDDNRIQMRPQTQEHYRQRVRDFEMRNLRRRPE